MFRRNPKQMTLPGMNLPRAKKSSRPRRAGGPVARARLVLVEGTITRRGFLARSLGWVTAGIAGVLGVPIGASLIAPALRKDEVDWNPIGRIGDPESGEPDLSVEGEPMLTTFTALVQDAYMSAAPQNVPVFVVNQGEDGFTVFDVRCTHLGCPVMWKEGEGFLSPCHGGVFDIEGRVMAGPPPRPLDRYKWRVQNGVLFAGGLYQVNEQLELAAGREVTDVRSKP